MARHHKARKTHKKHRGGNNTEPKIPEPAKPNTPLPMPTPAPAPVVGGAKHKKKTRKLSKWNMFVKKVYHDMKRKDKSATFSDALREASKRKSEM
jgi:hypothetical protein